MLGVGEMVGFGLFLWVWVWVALCGDWLVGASRILTVWLLYEVPTLHDVRGFCFCLFIHYRYLIRFDSLLTALVQCNVVDSCWFFSFRPYPLQRPRWRGIELVSSRDLWSGYGLLEGLSIIYNIYDVIMLSIVNLRFLQLINF